MFESGHAVGSVQPYFLSQAAVVLQPHVALEQQPDLAAITAQAMKVAAQLVRDAGFEPVAVPLARANEFAPPAPLFGKALPVSELRKQLGVTQ